MASSILPGRVIYARGIVNNLKCAKTQVQPAGIDLSLKQVLTYNSSGAVDFDNTRRISSQTSPLTFIDHSNKSAPSIQLYRGTYLVEFNETMSMPKDVMAHLVVQSSLYRSGASVQAGAVDSSHNGTLGAMLVVENPHGLRLFKNARIAQMVFQQVFEAKEACQGSQSEC